MIKQISNITNPLHVVRYFNPLFVTYIHLGRYIDTAYTKGLNLI